MCFAIETRLALKSFCYIFTYDNLPAAERYGKNIAPPRAGTADNRFIAPTAFNGIARLPFVTLTPVNGNPPVTG